MVVYWIVLPLAWVLVHILWRVEVIGKENVPRDRAVVLTPNHISDLDPVFVLALLLDWSRYRILAKKELFKNPVIGWFLGCLGAVPIDRGKADTETIDRVISECKQGTKVLIFPEGTRSKDGNLGKLKSGAFVIAGQAGADIVPCRIIYDTPDKRMHLFCRVRVCYGRPLPAAECAVADPRHEVRQLRAVRTRVAADLEALYAAHCFEPAPAPQTPPPVKGENDADPAC